MFPTVLKQLVAADTLIHLHKSLEFDTSLTQLKSLVKSFMNAHYTQLHITQKRLPTIIVSFNFSWDFKLSG